MVYGGRYGGAFVTIEKNYNRKKERKRGNRREGEGGVGVFNLRHWVFRRLSLLLVVWVRFRVVVVVASLALRPFLRRLQIVGGIRIAHRFRLGFRRSRGGTALGMPL